MEYRHASDPKSGDGASEEVTTEDGKFKYWRTATPLPLYVGIFRKRFICQCAKVFKSEAEYQLHFQKAADEELKFNEPI